MRTRFVRICLVLFVLAVAAANSMLLFFILWDMVASGEPVVVMLFFLSGSAHLMYAFFPWFIRDMVKLAVKTSYFKDVREGKQLSLNFSSGEASNFISYSTIFGACLCLAVLVLWWGDSTFSTKDSGEVLVTESNCLQIGGEPTYVNGRLVCIVS